MIVSLASVRAARALREVAPLRAQTAELRARIAEMRSAMHARGEALVREQRRIADAMGRVAAAADQVLTMREACEYLRATAPTVRKWITQRGLPATKIGDEWRFRRSDLALWISRQGGVR